jgi:putative mRNA 3-end processing factor
MPRPLAAEIEVTSDGMRVAESPLFLDARRPRALSFVSHAHSDHIARHDRVIATSATASLLAAKLGRIKRASVVTAPYGQAFDLGALKLSLHPAGHVKGSAQILIRREGRRILYTGDLGLSPSMTAEAAEVVPCDVLILESTFGHPRYRLPPRPEALARVDEFVAAAFRRNEVPVLQAYALGKGQEIIAHLARRGIPVRAERSIGAMTAAYRVAGCDLPIPHRFSGTVEPGEVLLVPPHPTRGCSLREVPRRRTAVLTGWAVDAGAARRYGADEAIALSDHADCQGLLEYAAATGARRVFTVHGFCQHLAKELRANGIQAQPLDKANQLELFE